MLAPDPETPPVTETPVCLDLVQSLNVLPELGLQNVGGNLQVLAFPVVAHSVEEPPGDTVAFGVANYVGDGIALLFGELAGPETRVDSQYFADQEAEASAHSLDALQGEGHRTFPVDVGVEDTVDVLESVVCVFDD